MIHYYYLHRETKDLISKPEAAVVADPAYFDSDFVQKVWKIDTTERVDGWILCVEALALGAKKERVFELKEKWGLTDEDAPELAKRAKLTLEKDGDQWCVKEGIKGAESTQVGFGATALEALADYARQGKIPEEMYDRI